MRQEEMIIGEMMGMRQEEMITEETSVPLVIMAEMIGGEIGMDLEMVVIVEMMVQGMMEEEKTVLLMAEMMVLAGMIGGKKEMTDLVEMMDLENPQLQLIHRQRRNL